MGGSWSQWLFWLFKYNWHLLTNQYFPRNCIVFIVQLCVCLPATTVWAEICIWFLGFLWELPVVIVCDTTCELWVEYSHRFFFFLWGIPLLIKTLGSVFSFSAVQICSFQWLSVWHCWLTLQNYTFYNCDVSACLQLCYFKHWRE